MPKATDAIHIPSNEISFSYARSSGPGGQNVNKVNSKAILHWEIGATAALNAGVVQRFTEKFSNHINKEGFVVITSDEYRDQPRNAEACLDKLKNMIASVLVPPKKRVATKPSKRQKAKRLDSKKQRSDRKQTRKRVSYD